MKTKDNTILITGGASGIGLALAERFYNAGNTVIICGRRAEKLEEAKNKFPGIHTHVCDISIAENRENLCSLITKEFPELNVIINNAGIQQRINLQRSTEDWNYYHQEIKANLEAPLHLTILFIPHLIQKQSASIINISSGLGITPATWAPIYSATKAALHSFTMSLRLQLAHTAVEVVEVLPPAVNTDLGGVGLHTFGVPVGKFADSVFAGFEKGDLEIGYGDTENTLRASRDEIDKRAKFMWENYLKNNPNF